MAALWTVENRRCRRQWKLRSLRPFDWPGGHEWWRANLSIRFEFHGCVAANLAALWRKFPHPWFFGTVSHLAVARLGFGPGAQQWKQNTQPYVAETGAGWNERDHKRCFAPHKLPRSYEQRISRIVLPADVHAAASGGW